MRSLLTVLMLLLASATTMTGRAHAQGDAAADSVLARAQDAYDEARFNDAIGLLRGAVDGARLAPVAELRARELLGRCYVKTNQSASARSEFKKILEQNANYRLDPIRVPPDEMSEFEAALKEFQAAQPPPAAPPATPAAPPTAKPVTAEAQSSGPSWTGFHVGADGEHGWGTAQVRTSTPWIGPNGYSQFWDESNVAMVAQTGKGTVRPRGFGGGLTVGYDYQRGVWLWGADAAALLVRRDGSRSATAFYPASAGTAQFTIRETTTMDEVFMFRGRAGYVLGRSLGYATAGLAGTRLKIEDSFTDNYATEHVSQRKSKVGLALGLGYEYAIQGKWTARLEYLYLHFGKVTAPAGILTDNTNITYYANPLTHTTTLTASSVRLGVGRRF